MIGTDLFELDDLNYLIVVGFSSRDIEVAAMQNTTKSNEINRAPKTSFARHKIPEQVRIDNSPQHASAEFTHFAKGTAKKRKRSIQGTVSVQVYPLPVDIHHQTETEK